MKSIPPAFQFVLTNLAKTHKLGGKVYVATKNRGATAYLLHVAYDRPDGSTIVFVAVYGKDGRFKALPATNALPATRPPKRLPKPPTVGSEPTKPIGRASIPADYSDSEALEAIRKIFAEAYPETL